MSDINLFYFSGTGNTKTLAKILAKAFENKGAAAGVFNIESGVPATMSKGILGIVYPVYALCPPSPILKFADSLPQTENGTKVFIIKSPGDPFFDGGSAVLLTKRLAAKGYSVFYESMIVMPMNIFIRYDDIFAKKLLDRAAEKAEKAAEDILAEKVMLYSPGLLIRFLSWIGGITLRTFDFIFGRTLSVTKDCDNCGVCRKVCPAKKSCIMCMRCIKMCPKKAIYSKPFGWLVIKRFYDLNKISLINEKTSPDRLKKFYSWFDNYFRR